MVRVRVLGGPAIVDCDKVRICRVDEAFIISDLSIPVPIGEEIRSSLTGGNSCTVEVSALNSNTVTELCLGNNGSFSDIVALSVSL